MEYYDESYDPDDNYGDEDQNDLMRLIDSWRPDEDPEDQPAPDTTSAREALKKSKKALLEAICIQGDELPF